MHARHIEQEIRDGAIEKEILEAIEVAIEMGIGPGTFNACFALEVTSEHFNHHSEYE